MNDNFNFKIPQKASPPLGNLWAFIQVFERARGAVVPTAEDEGHEVEGSDAVVVAGLVEPREVGHGDEGSFNEIHQSKRELYGLENVVKSKDLLGDLQLYFDNTDNQHHLLSSKHFFLVTTVGAE